MKKILSIIILMAPLLGFSQVTKQVEAFLGIPFGSSRASVITALDAKGGTMDTSTADYLIYENIKLGHRNTTYFKVRFVDDKAYEALFVFKPDAEGDTFTYYFGLLNDINDIYGKGDLETSYTDPYSEKDSDANKLVALQNDDATFVTNWISTNKNAIQAQIDKDLDVVLFYIDTALKTVATNKQKEKEKSDY